MGSSEYLARGHVAENHRLQDSAAGEHGGRQRFSHHHVARLASDAADQAAAGKTEAGARRRTTCQVFSTDPVDVRGYTQLDETVILVKN